MKKIICLILLLLLCLPPLTACQKTADTVRVWTLNGTTGFGMAPMIAAADKSTYTFTVEKDATVVRDAIINGTADIAALPTNVAAALYNATNGGVRVLALNTGSVLYAVGTDSTVTDLADLSGKTLFVPAQNPTFIVKALLERAGITDVVLDSTTYPTPDALRDAVATELVTLAILPEPMLTIAQGAAAGEGRTLNTLLDLGAQWRKYFGEESLVQGCVVVRTAFLEKHPAAVAAFLKDYEDSIHYVNSYPELAAAHIQSVGIFANAEIAANALPRCNIIFKSGSEMKAALHAFLANMPLKAIGGKMPDDNFYYSETK